MPLSPEGIESIAKAIVETQKLQADHEHEQHEHEQYQHDNNGRQQWTPPEWLKYVTPIVLILLGFAWTRVESASTADGVQIKLISDKIDTLETRLPLDYVPRAEHIRNAEIDRALTKEREDRVTRIESKVDRILENQESKSAKR